MQGSINKSNQNQKTSESAYVCHNRKYIFQIYLLTKKQKDFYKLQITEAHWCISTKQRWYEYGKSELVSMKING